MDDLETIKGAVAQGCLFWSEVGALSASLDELERNVKAFKATEYCGRWSKDDRKRIDAKDRAGQREIPKADPVEYCHRHAGSIHERKIVLAAMARVSFPAVRLERFRECGAAAVIEHSRETGKLRVRAFHCKDRNCPACAETKRRKVLDHLLCLMEGRRCSFITLTLAHNKQPLRKQLSRLIKCFRALRIKAVWRAQVKGGAYFIENKRSKNRRHWHPHLHIIAECGYIEHADLSVMWKGITGDSDVVHIRRIYDGPQDASYVCKYSTKAVERSAFEREEWLDEAIHAARGRHLMSTFGLWRRRAVAAVVRGPSDWKRVAGLKQAILAASRGEQWAVGLMTWLRHRSAPDSEATDAIAMDAAKSADLRCNSPPS